jgi:hypothetical protein
VFNLDPDDFCFYPEWLALLKGNMGNALSGSKIGEHDSLVIKGVAHGDLL